MQNSINQSLADAVLCLDEVVFRKYVMNGGDDGTRTRGLCRDSALFPHQINDLAV